MKLLKTFFIGFGSHMFCGRCGRILTLSSVLMTNYVTFIVFIVSFSPVAVEANSDLSISGSIRSYPLGGGLNIKTGYSQILWGTPPTKGSTNGSTPNPWYGYIRPGIELDTAGTYNYGTGYLELFPISFFGGRAGASVTHNGKAYADFDCEIYLCEGRLTSRFAELHLVLGAGPLFLFSRYRWEHWIHQNKSQNFLEVESGLPAQRGGDDLRSIKSMMGLTINANWTVAAIHVYSEMNSLKGIQKMAALALQYKLGAWSLTVGAGTFESSILKNQTTGLARLSWTPRPSIALAD